MKLQEIKNKMVHTQQAENIQVFFPPYRTAYKTKQELQANYLKSQQSFIKAETESKTFDMKRIGLINEIQESLKLIESLA